MKYIYAALIFAFLAPINLYAVTLQWDIPDKERIEILRTAEVAYFIENKAQKFYEERNIIDLTCYKRVGDYNHVKGVFSVYERKNKSDVFNLREQIDADFAIKLNGHYKVAENAYMPNLRHIPEFPEKDVKKGTSWDSVGELVFNHFSRPFKVIMPVTYTLKAIKRDNDLDIAVVEYTFVIDKDLTKRKYPQDFPLKIAGKNIGTIIWDIKNKRPIEIHDVYRVVFVFPNGKGGFTSYGFQMNIETKCKMYAAVTPEEKEKAKDELKKELPKDKGIDVDTDKRGLVLRMGEVLFDFDSSALKSETKVALDKIIKILKEKYPDREIIVEGHTDDRGSEMYNQKLSRKRAWSVADYFKKHGKRDKLSFKGYGKDKPIASNKTRKGRQKNRRVEIIIKLH